MRYTCVSTYLRQVGKLQAISLKTWIDSGNVVCITPHGKMALALDKETYQQLGIVGKKSPFKSVRNRWRIRIQRIVFEYVKSHSCYLELIP
jgi:ribonuclease P/MRP protein subunit RPP40